jgi:hypothetical protein
MPWAGYTLALSKQLAAARTALPELIAEVERLGARLGSIQGDAFAAVNPANWQKPHTKDDLRECFEKTLDDIAEDAREEPDWLAKVFTERSAEVERLREALEQDRTTVADGINAIKKALAAREGLRLGRGSYEWDDDRWKDEFGEAYDEIVGALEPLALVAGNWQHCSEKHEDIKRARQALDQPAREAGKEKDR